MPPVSSAKRRCSGTQIVAGHRARLGDMRPTLLASLRSYQPSVGGWRQWGRPCWQEWRCGFRGQSTLGACHRHHRLRKVVHFIFNSGQTFFTHFCHFLLSYQGNPLSVTGFFLASICCASEASTSALSTDPQTHASTSASVRLT